ncbi:MAG: hypothetical protein IKZ49_03820 [Alphaproteobacteria bacterium]|nr:hypothetical protein [Alphaproteobacteria bacterium]
MKNIIKTISLIGLITAVYAADAATARVGVVGKTTSRLPSIAGYVTAVGTGTIATSATGVTTTASTLLTNSECIDNYTGCLKGADACGGDFQECTTNVLFHAQMPKCLSILSQCTSSGINDLFGTSNTTALSNIATKNSFGEVTKYTYPTDGSVLGQMITGAKIANQYDTPQCIKRYTSCLKKDSVCGNDFELCTTDTEFRKQSVACGSTLARCQSEGIIELYGSTNTSAAPSGSSRLGVAISEGADLAAANAVSTCYKVADQCILNACGTNPIKCMVDKSGVLAKIADAISSGSSVTPEELTQITSMTSSSDVSAYIKNMCLDTIGGNKYCYATFLGNGQMPSASQLRDEDNKDEIFGEAYASRMNSVIKQKVQDLVNKFDTKAKTKCLENIKSCAMRSCGNGLGSVCYSQVFGTNGQNTINGKATYEGIKTACEAIINTDTNCQYAAANANNNMYTYTYSDSSVFTTLFPAAEDSTNDPIGAVASLNASLSTSYNDAAIAQMKKQCANVAVSCVKSMCGKDYVNCYRNRTDVMSNTYNTGSAGFDRSMNKVGGVLDYTIVTGLCVGTVKNAEVCEEHLKIEAVKLEKDTKSSTWGDSVRGDWLGAAGSISAKETLVDVTIGCRTKTDSENCDPNAIEACDYVDADGCLYDEKVTQSWTEYSLSQSANNLFQEVLMDIEKEAQAKYNAKLTKEQNVCLANNKGGIMGASDNGSTFMWVKLKSNKVPKDYAMKGLQTKNFVASNELYGSFCRAKITIMSDDKAIQDALGEKATAYFAVGDAFTCGSWIDQKTLDNITKAVGEKARKEAGEGSAKEKATMAWSTVGGFLAGGLGGFFGMDAIQKNGGSLGGLLQGKGIKQTKANTTAANECLSHIINARSSYDSSVNERDPIKAAKNFQSAVDYGNKALRSARSAGASVSDIKTFKMGAYSDETEIATAIAATQPVATTATTTYTWDTTDKANVDSLIANIEAINTCGEKSRCRIYLNTAKQFLTTTPSDVIANSVISNIKNAYAECDKGNTGGATPCQNNATIKSGVESLKLAVVGTTPATTATTVDTTTLATTPLPSSVNRIQDSAEWKEFPDNLDKLETACSDVTAGETEEEAKSRRNKNLIAGAALGAAGAALGIGISKTALDIKYEKAENEAIKEWMEQVGEHITCYLGGEELGSYGDVISFDVE